MTSTSRTSDPIAGSALVTFEGTELSEEAERLLLDPAVAGVSLGRHRNVRDAAQVRALVDTVQGAENPDGLPRLVATDLDMGALGQGPSQVVEAVAALRAGEDILLIRTRHPDVDGFETSHPPTPSEIADLGTRASGYDLVVLGTLDASRDPRQADLVAAILHSGPAVVWVAMRTPWDLRVHPDAPTHACTYGILRPSMESLAAALWGEIGFHGRLPVALDERWPRGHGLDAAATGGR